MPSDAEKQQLALLREWPVEVAAEYFDIADSDARRYAGATGATLDRFKLEQEARL